jgi:hypothetical protein
MSNQNALIDSNSRQSMLGVLDSDGVTLTRAKANPSNHALKIDDNTTGSDNGGATAAIDENGRQTMYAESSDGDGAFVALYVDSSGNLLVDSL